MLRFEDLNDRQRALLLDTELSIDALATRFGVCRRSVMRYRKRLKEQQAAPAKEKA